MYFSFRASLYVAHATRFLSLLIWHYFKSLLAYFLDSFSWCQFFQKPVIVLDFLAIFYNLKLRWKVTKSSIFSKSSIRPYLIKERSKYNILKVPQYNPFLPQLSKHDATHIQFGHWLHCAPKSFSYFIYQRVLSYSNAINNIFLSDWFSLHFKKLLTAVFGT